MERREPIALRRAVEVTLVPSGEKHVLAEGSWVVIQQILGGHFTVMTDRGGLARIADQDADALGRDAERHLRALRHDVLRPRVVAYARERCAGAIEHVLDLLAEERARHDLRPQRSFASACDRDRFGPEDDPDRVARL